MKHGIGYLPEDRKRDGIIGDLSVRDNIILARQVLDGFFQSLFRRPRPKRYADEYIKLLSIKTASTGYAHQVAFRRQPAEGHSGALAADEPRLYLILDEPTRGIDVGTKVEIQKLVLQLAAEGKSVTFISSEIDEMLRVCSRLIVMRDRQVVGELRGSDLNQNSIMKTIAGGEQVMNETTEKRQGNFLTRLAAGKQIFIPLAALLLLIIFNLDCRPVVLCRLR